MRHLPVFFNVAGRKVTVVGEGLAADRRAALARSAGAEVVRGSDFAGAMAAFVATGDEESDRLAAAAARRAGVPVNVADRPGLSDFILPAIVDRGDVVVAVSTGGASPTLATLLRGRIEALLPERVGALARLAETFRSQVRMLIAEPTARRAFWRRLLEGPAARLALAGDDVGARRLALRELDEARAQRPAGICHIVDAGPGDPDLLTLRAARLLQEADAVLHDEHVPPAILARGRRDAEYIAVAADADIEAEITGRVRAGQVVVRLQSNFPLLDTGHVPNPPVAFVENVGAARRLHSATMPVPVSLRAEMS